MGRPCGSRASHYDPSRKLNLCGLHSHGNDNVRTGHGPSWYAQQAARADGFDAAAPDEICESGAHPECAVVAKAVKDGVALCLLCSFDRELDELRAFNAALADDRRAA